MEQDGHSYARGAGFSINLRKSVFAMQITICYSEKTWAEEMILKGTYLHNCGESEHRKSPLSGTMRERKKKKRNGALHTYRYENH